MWGKHWVTGLVGPRFEAYARLLHPLADYPGFSTWEEVARANGRTMHPSVRWERIRPPTASNGRSQPGDPIWGQLNAWALDELCAILMRHTTTPQVCYFAVWSGSRVWQQGHMQISYYAPNGALPDDVQPPRPAPSEWQLDSSGPTFSLAHRIDYHLFEGHVGEAARFGLWVNESWFYSQSPQLFWPADHSWCVATELGEDSTIIGGSRELVDELCASATLEALSIPPDAPFEDCLNL